jgi:hypothetical protein
MEVQLHVFLTSALDGGEWSASRPGCFIRGTPRIGGRMCPKADLDAMVSRLSVKDAAEQTYDGVSKSFRTESITKYTLTTINTRWEGTQRVMVAKLTCLTHKIAIQLHVVVESCNICSSRSRRPVRKLLDTPSYKKCFDVKTVMDALSQVHTVSLLSATGSWRLDGPQRQSGRNAPAGIRISVSQPVADNFSDEIN